MTTSLYDLSVKTLEGEPQPLSLYKGNIAVASRKSDYSLYRTDLSSFTMGDSYDQKDAAGFIRILGLPSRSRAALHQEVAK